jgi:uncharacterized protein (TIGR00251 family)
MSWLTESPTGVTLVVVVQPGAAYNGIVGPLGDALKVRLSAPPLQGRANAALVSFLAGVLDVHPSQITILHGAHGRRKLVHISGVRIAAVRQRLTWPTR